MAAEYLDSGGKKDIIGVVHLNPNNLEPVSGKSSLTSNVAAQLPPGKKSFQFVLTGIGAVSCDVTIWISNNGVNYRDIYVSTLYGTNTDSDEITLDYSFAYTKVVVSNLTGTGAACALSVSY